MGKEDLKKEMRMFARSPMTRVIAFTVIERAGINPEINEELRPTYSWQQTGREKSRGITKNVSEGGLCMITEQELEESEVIRIELPVTETFLSAPTLAQVKWVSYVENKFNVGLAYLF